MSVISVPYCPAEVSKNGLAGFLLHSHKYKIDVCDLKQQYQLLD